MEALIVIDVQNDFCPGGALAVEGGDTIVGRINELMAEAPIVVLTQDWHMENHSSFAVQHGAEPFSIIDMPYGPQALWPVHCVQNTHGADFHPDLERGHADLILRKGFRSSIDSYSAFFENDRVTATGLAGYLRDRGVTDVVLVGLALDYCVAWSALDASRLGFNVRVLGGVCRAINLNGSLEAARWAMCAAGVVIED